MESSIDDLGTGEVVVLGRAVSTLRSDHLARGSSCLLGESRTQAPETTRGSSRGDHWSQTAAVLKPIRHAVTVLDCIRATDKNRSTAPERRLTVVRVIHEVPKGGRLTFLLNKYKRVPGRRPILLSLRYRDGPSQGDSPKRRIIRAL